MPDNATSESLYRATSTNAGLFDRSATGKIVVSGPEAPEFLHNLCTNDVRNLPLGGGCEAFFCNERARALFLARIYHVRLAGDDALWIDVALGQGPELYKHLDRHLIAEKAELADRTNDFAQFHLAGPKAASILSNAMGEPVPDLQFHQHMERAIGPSTVASIRRHDPLGLPGFDIVCLATRAEDLQTRLLAAGAALADDTVWEWLRIEAGTPEQGKDFDDKRFVVEIGRTDAISFAKGCYLGQEPIVMSRDRTGFVNRRLCRLKLNDMNGIGPGAKLYSQDEVGVLTSTANTPNQGPIALGYLRRGFESPGTVIKVGSVDGTEAQVLAMPAAG